MYEEGDIADGPNGQTLVFRGGQWVPQGAAQLRGIVVKQGNPYEMPKDAASLAQTQVSTATDRAQLPYAGSKAQADAARAAAEARSAQIAADKASREAALPATGAKGAANLQRAIDDIRAHYKTGPGATSGIAGLADYLPYTENQQFDAAGNAVRGFVGPALGLTGGQLNTEKEAQRAVGPYVPQSSDRDSVILDKIARLQGLADTMAAGLPKGGADRQQTGVPALGAGGGAGTVPPAGPMQSTSYYAGPSAPGGPSLAQGQFRTEADPAMAGVNSRIAGMLKSGKPDGEIASYMQSVGLDPAIAAQTLQFRRANPGYTGDYAVKVDERSVPMSATRQFMNSAGQSAFGAGAINAGNAVTGGNLDSIVGAMGGNADLARAGIDGVSQQHPGAAMAGNLIGGTVAAGGLEALAPARIGLWGARGADAAYGAIAGAGGADNGDRLTGALSGTVAGVGGGMFGRGVSRAAGGALTGVRNEAVRGLSAAGIPLTFGQTVSQSGRLGGAVKGIEDRLSGLPLVGDMVNARRRDGLQGFNAAAFKEGVAPIGSTAVSGIGEQGIDNARQMVKSAYGDALSGVNVTPDAQFGQDMGAALTRGASIPRTGPEFSHVVSQRVAPMFASPSGAVDGRQIQDMLQGIKGTNFGNDAMGSSASDALGDVGGAVTDLVGRQFPEAMPKLQGANTAYRNINILGDAVGKGVNTGGVFTPAQLGLAARSNTTKFGGKLNAVSESRPFFDLQRNAQDVLPGQVPDSGTAGRLALAALLPAGTTAAGAGIGAANGDAAEGGGIGGGVGLGTLAVLAAGGSKPAQKLLTAAMLKRPDNMVRTGKALGRRSAIGGMFGAGAAPLLLPQ